MKKKGFNYNLKVETYPYFELHFEGKNVISEQGFDKMLGASLKKLEKKMNKSLDKDKVKPKDDIEIEVPDIYKNYLSVTLKPHIKEVDEQLMHQQNERILFHEIYKIFFKKEKGENYTLYVFVKGQLAGC